MITHFKVWNIWRKEFKFNAWFKFKVLFGLAPSGTFVFVRDRFLKEYPKKKTDSDILIPIIGAIIVGLIFTFIVASIIKFSLASATYYEGSYLETPAPANSIESVDKPIEPIVEPEDEDVVVYFNVPLSEDVQDHIFENCNFYNVEPTLVIAIIEKESRYNEQAIGDRGRSYGLMQIQPRWHYSRMVDLGCKDLLDPYQNISVGVSYLSELLSRGNSVEWVLMAYNGGPSYANSKAAAGTVSDYVYRVLEIKEGLE